MINRQEMIYSWTGIKNVFYFTISAFLGRCCCAWIPLLKTMYIYPHMNFFARRNMCYDMNQCFNIRYYNHWLWFLQALHFLWSMIQIELMRQIKATSICNYCRNMNMRWFGFINLLESSFEFAGCNSEIVCHISKFA